MLNRNNVDFDEEEDFISDPALEVAFVVGNIKLKLSEYFPIMTDEIKDIIEKAEITLRDDTTAKQRFAYEEALAAQLKLIYPETAINVIIDDIDEYLEEVCEFIAVHSSEIDAGLENVDSSYLAITKLILEDYVVQ